MHIYIVKCYRPLVLFVILSIVFIGCFHQADGKPNVVIDIVDDQTTMADEYALTLHSIGAIHLIGFVVTEDGANTSANVANRLKSLTNRLLPNTNSRPSIFLGTKAHALNYLMDPKKDFAPGNVRTIPDILKFHSLVKRTKLSEQQKIYYVTQGRLSSLAYLFAFDKNNISKFTVVGDFCIKTPSPSVKNDKAAWRIVINSEADIISWFANTSSEDEEEYQEIDLPFHPSHFANSRYADSWILSKFWNPYSEAGFIQLEDKWNDSCLVGLSYTANPDIFSSPVALIAKSDDTEDKYNFSFSEEEKGKIKKFKSVQTQNLSRNVLNAFDMWVNIHESRIKRKVILDGNFGFGISDFAAVLRLIYSNQVDLRGLTVAPFLMGQLSSSKSLDLAYLWVLDFLYTQLQLKTKIFLGAPHSTSPANQMKNANFEARNFILNEASQATPSNRLHVIMTGPATNLALALKARPQIASRIHVWLIGAEPSQDGTSWKRNHYNSQFDPAAFEFIMKAPDLKRSILVPKEDDPWKLSKNSYLNVVSPDDGGWWYLIWYWENFVANSPLLGSGLSKDASDFNEVGVIEAFLDPTATKVLPAGFKFLNKSGGTYWLTQPKIQKMNNHFLNSVGITVFNQR